MTHAFERETPSVWEATAAVQTFQQLWRNDLHVDVAIVGGGITGLTTALLLKNAGKRVAVLEARSVAGGVTAKTSGHLTLVMDTRHFELVKQFGHERTQLVVDAGKAALDFIERVVKQYGIECGFTRVPGYLFTERKEQLGALELELNTWAELGLRAEKALTPVPFAVKGGLRIEGQAQFNPRAYLAPLAARIHEGESYVFGNSPVTGIREGDPCQLEISDGRTLKADQVVLATHSPLNVVLLQTKLARYQSYVIAGPAAHLPDALLWDMEDPYHYVRTAQTRNGPVLVVGGGDHKTGKEPGGTPPFTKVLAYAERFGIRPTMNWSQQVLEPVDGLPYIGRNSAATRVQVATGFSGTGLVYGTVAGMICADRCLGRDNAWSEAFTATRLPPIQSISEYLGENADFPAHLVGDWLKGAEVTSLDDIGRGEGKIAEVGGKRLAVYRDDNGRVKALSAVCTHLGCQVTFNSTAKSWDCPCHGSRFDTDGKVIDGPAVKPLPREDIEAVATPLVLSTAG